MQHTPVKSFYVYALYRDTALTLPFYIGKGQSRRMEAHEKTSEIAKNHNVRKNRTIQKMKDATGFVPKRILAANLSEADAFELEVRLINVYGRLDIGTGCLTNLSNGGLGATHSAETRAKIKAKRALQVMTEETKAKIAAANRGRKHSPETCAKISAARKGIAPNLSPEGRARQIAAVTGRKHTAEASASMSRTRTGRKLPASHVAAISRGLKKKHMKERQWQLQ